MSKEPLVVYWAPLSTHENDLVGEWNMLFPEPVNLMSDLMSIKNPDRGNKHFFSCPGSSNFFKNTFVFSNGLDSEYDFDFTNPESPLVTPIGNTYLGYSIQRPPTLVDRPMFRILMNYLFFSEESVNATFTPPFYHPPKHTKVGTCPPGTMDISQWFRPYTLELQLWEMKGKLSIEEDEPLFYVTFESDRPIILKRFAMNGKLVSYQEHCIKAPEWQGKNLPLSKRYKAFKKSRMGDLVAKEIKNNLL